MQTTPVTAIRREGMLTTSLALSRQKKNHYSLREGAKAEAQRSEMISQKQCGQSLTARSRSDVSRLPCLSLLAPWFTKGCFCLCRLSISAPVTCTLGHSSLKAVQFLYWIYNTHIFLNIQQSSDALKKMKAVSALLPALRNVISRDCWKAQRFRAHARKDVPGTLTWCPPQPEQKPHHSIH